MAGSGVPSKMIVNTIEQAITAAVTRLLITTLREVSKLKVFGAHGTLPAMRQYNPFSASPTSDKFSR